MRRLRFSKKYVRHSVSYLFGPMSKRVMDFERAGTHLSTCTSTLVVPCWMVKDQYIQVGFQLLLAFLGHFFHEICCFSDLEVSNEVSSRSPYGLLNSCTTPSLFLHISFWIFGPLAAAAVVTEAKFSVVVEITEFPIITCLLLASLLTSENTSQIKGSGSLPRIWPLTSSSSLLSPARNSNTRSFSNIFLNLALSLAQIHSDT